MRRSVPVALLVVVVLTAAALPAAGIVLDPPVTGPVLVGFHVSAPYGAGHRGVDIAAPPGTSVRAPAAGRVTFAGPVVDAQWVTVDHGSLRTTVGPLAEVHVTRGDRVARGAVLGRSARAHGRDAVHWSARRGQTYVDPLAVGHAVATLVPVTAPGHQWWPRHRVR